MELERLPDGRLRVPGGLLTTAEVEQLMHDLALARNEMQPEVPLAFKDAGPLLVTMNEPHMQVSRNAVGDITLALRHRGFGWVVFFMKPRQAAFLRDALDKRVRGIPVDLAAEDLPQGGDTKH